jgi:hypothetical protein
MPDPRSLMQEFRLLDQKRQGLGLSQAEEARHAELKELVGSTAAPPVRSGFNVNAAAAQLRESLLPAGLRSRPLDSPAPPPAAPPAAPAWQEPALEPGPASDASPAFDTAADSFFDPTTLGQEVRPQAWNPEAPGYDPDAPYDEAAWIAAGYDPNATYDWAALGYDVPAAEQPAAEAVEAAPELLAEPAAEELPAATPEPFPGAGYDELPEPGALALEPAAEEVLDFVEEVDAPPAGEAAPLQFGEYDANGPAAFVSPPDYGGPEGDSIPGGEPLELGDAPIDLQPEEALDASFELASDGSFGEAGPPAQPAPWSASSPGESADGWESAPALELASSFEPAQAAEATAAEPIEFPPEAGAPELALELPPEPGFAYQAAPEPALDVAPEPELALAPEPEPEPLALAPELPPAYEPEPLAPLELEPPPAEVVLEAIPPEIAAAYDEAVAPPAAAEPPPEPPPAPEPEPAWEPPAPPAFDQADPEPIIEPYEEPPVAPVRVEGSHRVVVHTIDGQVKRGLLTDASLDAADLALDTQGPAGLDVVATAGIKAIFFMLASGERAPAPEGTKVRVTFRDGRQVAGFSPDYQEGSFGFFMIPADTRTNTGRIWVYQAAVRTVVAG